VVLVDIGGETCAVGLGDVFAPEGEEVGLWDDEEGVSTGYGTIPLRLRVS
jgi:hypothetical protein